MTIKGGKIVYDLNGIADPVYPPAERGTKNTLIKKIMKRSTIVLLFVTFLAAETFSQTISKEELIFLTSEWKGESFPDGRPKIPDDLMHEPKILISMMHGQY